GFWCGAADQPAGATDGAAGAAERGPRLRLPVDVRQPPAVAGALRHLQPDPRPDAPDQGRPDGHQPGDARLDGHGVAVRHAQRDVRQPDGLRHRPRGLRRPGDERQAGDAPGGPRGDARHPRARELPAGRLQGDDAAVPLGADVVAGGLGRGVRSVGPQGGGRGGRRLHPPAGRRRHRRLDDRERPDRGQQRRSGPDDDHLLRRRPDVRRGRPGPPARAVPVVRRDGRQPRRRHRRQVRRVRGRAAGAHRLHPRPPGLRLQRARPGGEHPHVVRARRDRRPLLPARPRGGPHRQARAAQGHRLRPVRRIPPARQQGGDPPGLRRDGHARPPRPRDRPHL
ncbi:MAG: N5,N10-methylenetetrahydromethanopterin reductase-related protein, SCO6416-type, partial [uncultured Friedmanniella sp.]